MDAGYKTSQQFMENVKNGEGTVEGIIKKIKEQDLALIAVDAELPSQVDEYSRALLEDLEALEATIDVAKDIEIPAQQIAAQPLELSQSLDLQRISALYLIILVLSVFLGAGIFPAQNLPLLSNSVVSAFLVSLFIAALCVVAGFISSPKVSVVTGDETGASSIIIEKRGSGSIVPVVIIAIALTALYWQIFQGEESSAIRAGMAVLVNVACFFVGTRLISSLSPWISLIASFTQSSAGAVIITIEWLVSTMSVLLELADTALKIASMPVSRLFSKNVQEPVS